MKIKIKGIYFMLAFALVALSFQSCATVFGGRGNSLIFPEDSTTTVEAFIDGESIGIASGKIKLPKGKIQHGSLLELKDKGFETQEHLILLKPHTGYVIANFAVGAIPLIVDFATGDILRPNPRKFEVKLEETE